MLTHWRVKLAGGRAWFLVLWGSRQFTTLDSKDGETDSSSWCNSLQSTAAKGQCGLCVFLAGYCAHQTCYVTASRQYLECFVDLLFWHRSNQMENKCQFLYYMFMFLLYLVILGVITSKYDKLMSVISNADKPAKLFHRISFCWILHSRLLHSRMFS